MFSGKRVNWKYKLSNDIPTSVAIPSGEHTIKFDVEMIYFLKNIEMTATFQAGHSYVLSTDFGNRLWSNKVLIEDMTSGEIIAEKTILHPRSPLNPTF